MAICPPSQTDRVSPSPLLLRHEGGANGMMLSRNRTRASSLEQNGLPIGSTSLGNQTGNSQVGSVRSRH